MEATLTRATATGAYARRIDDWGVTHWDGLGLAMSSDDGGDTMCEFADVNRAGVLVRRPVWFRRDEVQPLRVTLNGGVEALPGGALHPAALSGQLLMADATGRDGAETACDIEYADRSRIVLLGLVQGRMRGTIVDSRRIGFDLPPEGAYLLVVAQEAKAVTGGETVRDELAALQTSVARGADPAEAWHELAELLGTWVDVRLPLEWRQARIARALLCRQVLRRWARPGGFDTNRIRATWLGQHCIRRFAGGELDFAPMKGVAVGDVWLAHEGRPLRAPFAATERGTAHMLEVLGGPRSLEREELVESLMTAATGTARERLAAHRRLVTLLHMQ